MDVQKELIELRRTSGEKAANKARLDKWRDRYFKACGRYPDGNINMHLYCVAEFGVQKTLSGESCGSRN